MRHLDIFNYLLRFTCTKVQKEKHHCYHHLRRRVKSISSVNNSTNCYFGYKTEKWKMEKAEHKIDEFAKG